MLMDSDDLKRESKRERDIAFKYDSSWDSLKLTLTLTASNKMTKVGAPASLWRREESNTLLGAEWTVDRLSAGPSGVTSI